MKKGQIEGFLAFLIMIVGLIIVGFIFKSLFLSSGTSTDIAYGVEKNVFWSKLYLKDDHKTVYCMNDDRLIQIAKDASIKKQKVTVTYSEYLLKGSLCGGGNYQTVVVTNIEVNE